MFLPEVATDKDNSAVAMPSRVKVQKDNVVVLMGSAPRFVYGLRHSVRVLRRLKEDYKA